MMQPDDRTTIAVSQQSRLILRALAARQSCDMRDCLDRLLRGAAILCGLEVDELLTEGSGKRGRVAR